MWKIAILICMVNAAVIEGNSLYRKEYSNPFEINYQTPYAQTLLGNWNNYHHKLAEQGLTQMIPVDQLFNQGEYRFIPGVDRARLELNGDNIKSFNAPEIKKSEEVKVKSLQEDKKEATRKFDEKELSKPTLSDLFKAENNQMSPNEMNNELRMEFEDFLMKKYSNLVADDNESEFEARHIKTLSLPSFSKSLENAQKRLNDLVDSSVKNLNTKIEAMNDRIEAALNKFTSTLAAYLPLPSIPKPKEFLVEDYYKPKDKKVSLKPIKQEKTTPYPSTTKKYVKHTTKDSWYDNEDWETTFKPYSKKTSPKYDEQYYRSTTEKSIPSSKYVTPSTIFYYRSDSEGTPSEKVVEVTKEKMNEIVESVKSLLDEKENIPLIENQDAVDVRGPQKSDLINQPRQNFESAEPKSQLDDEAPRSDIRVTLEDVENMDGELEEIQNFDEENSESNFDDLGVVQLIPVIIEQLKLGGVTPDESVTLSNIFGDLWEFIVEESKRDPREEMNPLLKTLLQSEEVRLMKREIKEEFGNDIQKNSVRKIYRGNAQRASKTYIQMDDDKTLLSPSEQVLKMVAAIIHKANLEKKIAKARKHHNQKKKRQQNPLGIVTVRKPHKRHFRRANKKDNINRIKRELVSLRVSMQEMMALLAQQTLENESEEDYQNDESYEEYQDYPMESTNYEANPYQHKLQDDYDDGSVYELIQIAETHRLRRQKADNIQELDDYEEFYGDYDAAEDDSN